MALPNTAAFILYKIDAKNNRSKGGTAAIERGNAKESPFKINSIISLPFHQRIKRGAQ